MNPAHALRYSYERVHELRSDTLRIWAEAIVTRLTVLHEKHNQNDEADKRNQTHEKPPTTAISIVEPSDAHRDGRKQHCKHKQTTQDRCAFAIRRAAEKNTVQHRQNDRDHQIKQREVPVLAAS